MSLTKFVVALVLKFMILQLHYILCSSNDDFPKKFPGFSWDDFYFETKYTCGFKEKEKVMPCWNNVPQIDTTTIGCIYCPYECAYCFKPIKSPRCYDPEDKIYRGCPGFKRIYCTYYDLATFERPEIKGGNLNCKKKGCSSKLCKNNAQCVEVFYSFFCKCDNAKYYGRTCDSSIKPEWSTKLASGVQIWYPRAVVTSFYFPYMITIDNAGDEDDILIEVSTGTGYVNILKKHHKNLSCSQDSKKCRCTQGCSSVYSGTLFHAARNMKKEYLYLPTAASGTRLEGHVDSITIKVFNQKFTEGPVFEARENSFSRTSPREIVDAQRTASFQFICALFFNFSDQSSCGPTYDKKLTVEGELLFSTTNIQTVQFNYKLKVLPAEDTFKCDESIENPLWSIQIFSVDVLPYVHDYNQDKKTAVEKCETTLSNTKCVIKANILRNGEFMVKAEIKLGVAKSVGPYRTQQIGYFTYINKAEESVFISIQKEFNITTKEDIILQPDFDKKLALTFKWTCETLSGGECSTLLPSAPALPIKAGDFNVGVYNVTVTATIKYGTVSASASTIINVVDASEKPPDQPIQKKVIKIVCTENCEEFKNPGEDIVVKAVESNSGNVVTDPLTWKMFEGTPEEGKEIPIESVTSEDRPMRLNELVVSQGKLKEGKTYTIVLRGLDQEVRYVIKNIVSTPPSVGTCKLTPEKGIKAYDYFTIECEGWSDKQKVLLFEFFDKGPDDLGHYVGRMMGYSSNGRFRNFRLTRGTVVMYAINSNGLSSNFTINVQLTEMEDKMRRMEVLRSNFSQHMKNNDVLAALRTASVIAEVLTDELPITDIITELITSLVQVPVSNPKDMKLGLSTVLILLTNGPQKGKHKLDDLKTKDVAKVLVELARIYKNDCSGKAQVFKLRRDHIEQLSRHFLDSIDAAVLSRDEGVILSPEEDVSYIVMKNLERASQDITKALRDALLCMGNAQIPGKNKSEIISKEKISTMAALADDVKALGEKVNNDPGTNVIMPRNLAEATSVTGDVTLQFSVLKENLFWWAQGHISTDLALVELHHRSKYKFFIYITNLSNKVSVFMKVKTINKGNISGTVTQIDPTLDENLLDLQLLVHRILPPPLSKLYITFNFTEPKTSLRVLVIPNRRPDWNLMMKESIIIQEDNPIYNVPYDTIERNNFYYMGILPTSDVPVNSSIGYTFEIYYVLCQVWQTQWINHQCLVGDKTTESTVECKCPHFSIYAGAIAIPPNDINPILDAHLFLNVLSNPWVVFFVALLLIFFLLAILWAALKDRKDKLSMDVIVLDDNYPGESFGYLVAVHTGARFTAGTTANVGLRLYGDIYASRPHILSCTTRKVLQRGNDDWFLLCYPTTLGVIHSVQLWHDHSGRSPDWFCSKVIVYDLIAKTQYIFLVEQWLALEINEFPEAVVRSATVDEILSVKRLFLDNSDFGFRENHTWLSVFVRHPRSTVSRKERLTVLMVSVMVSMLASIMFFKSSDELVAEMDHPEFSLSTREIIVSVESFMVAAVFTLLVLYLFKKSYRQKKYTDNEPSTLYTSSRVPLTDPSEFWMSDKTSTADLTNMKVLHSVPPKKRKDMNIYENIVESIRKFAHPKKLRPVILSNEDSGIVVHKGYLIAAWVISISVIVISSYLVMLYSLKFGKIKSQLWLSSVVMTLGQDIFLLSPIRIIFFAVILSVAFERMFDVASFRLNIKDAIKLDLVGDVKYLGDLCERRSHNMYYPISEERKKVLRQIYIRKMRWRALLDFCMVLLFILVLSLVMKNMWSGAHYNSNAHSVQMLATPNDHENVAMYEIFNRTDFISYLSTTFVGALYSFRWFNTVEMPKLTPVGEAFRRKDWFADFTSRLMGIPRLRQLRVKPDRCDNNNLIERYLIQCILPWTESNNDDDDYGISWHGGQWSDQLRYLSYWKYSEPWNSSAFLLPGKTGIVYPTGGYIAELGTTRSASVQILSDLRESGWQDVYTRVTFVELTLYNVNNYLFSQVTLIVEHLQFGNLLILSNAESVHIREEISIWNTAYIVFIFILFLRIVYNVNRNGFLLYLSGPLNIYELFVIILGVLSVALYILHLYTSSIYVQKYQQQGLDSFFNFKAILYYFLITKVFLWMLFCFSVFRLFISWRFGDSYYFFFYTFLLSGRWILIVSPLFLLFFFVIWRFIGYFIDAQVFSAYRIYMVHQLSYGLIHEKDSSIKTETVLFLLCIFAKFFNCVMFVLFTYYYKIGRNRLAPQLNFNFITFVIHEFKNVFRKKETQHKPNKSEQ